MKRYNIYVLWLILSMAITSCSEDKLDSFVENDYLYFNSEEQTEVGFPLQEFSFLFEEEAVTSKNVQVPVQLAGRFAEHDRTFNVSIVDSLTTAVEGVDYALEQQNFILKANEKEGAVIVKVNLTPELDEEKLKIALKIEDGDDFSAGSEGVLVLSITNRLLKPDWWEILHRPIQFGPFTEKKGGLLMKYMGVTDGRDPFLGDPYTFEMTYLGTTYVLYNGGPCQAKLNGFKSWLLTSDGAPYYDENGDLIYNTMN